MKYPKDVMARDPKALLQKAAEAEASAKSPFSYFSGKEQKYLDAVEYYTQAANAFRLHKSSMEAGRAFEKAATVQKNNLQDLDDAANTMTEAFKVYRMESPEDAARCLDEAIQQYCARGNFRRAAKQEEDLGELFEKEIHDNQRAMKCYENAASWYEGDNAQALAIKNWLKVGDLAALGEDYSRAIELFEKVAQQSLNSNLMRYSVKDYFLKAGLCHLATGDLVSTRRALNKYREQDSMFRTGREFHLLNELVDASDNGNEEMFASNVFQYDTNTKLDAWKTEILLRIKSSIIEKQDSEFS